MKKTTISLISLVMLLSFMLFGCQASGEVEKDKDKDILFQYSTLGSLMAGVYDGDMTYAELKKHGDFGMGTFNSLDGEMIELDQQVYQVKSDGVAYPVEDKMKAPFAMVTFFEPDQTVKITDTMDCGQLKSHLDSLLPTKNIPYAIKITGKFKYMKTRSAPSQTKPYLPLLEALKKQATFEFQQIEGVMLGFRLPSYMEIANSVGYHFHFITTDRKAGGHVLECQAQGVTAEIDYTDKWNVVLPKDAEFYKVEISSDKFR